MHRYRFFGVALHNVSGEDKSPLNVTAGRTHEGVVFVASDRHGVVLDHVHQLHFRAARQALHRKYSLQAHGAEGSHGVKRVLQRAARAFLLFESSHDIDQIAAAVTAAFNPRTDMALVGMPEFKSARLIGASTRHTAFRHDDRLSS